MCLYCTAMATTSSASSKKRPRSLTDKVVDAFAEHIRNGRFSTGAKLPTETGIMREHSVSRTVVREAISRLQAAGLVETRHGIGTFVLEPNAGQAIKIATDGIFTMLDTLAVLELRLGLETEVAALAAVRRSDQDVLALSALLDDFEKHTDQADGSAISADLAFHLKMASITGNQYFQDILRQLSNIMIPRARIETAQLTLNERRIYSQRVNHEHENIYAAIERRDPEAARAAMRTHLTNSRERLRKAYEQMTHESAKG